MVNIANKGYVSPIAVHPGETLKEALEYIGMSQADLASRVELSEKSISLIFNGAQPVTPESALKFERVLGVSQRMLLEMQAYYDADKFRLAEVERLEEEAKLLPNYFFYNELAKHGYVEETRNKTKKVEELLKYYGVNSLTSVRAVFPVAFRRTNLDREISEEALAAWLRMGPIQAQKRQTKDFNREILLKNISKMRSLTRESANTYSQALIDLCAEAGVVLVYTPHLKKTCVNGATQWLSPTRALVQVSLYYASADIFWFTLFHELGHILKHSKKETFIEFEGSKDRTTEMEKEADDFAQKVLIPSQSEEAYEALKKSLTKTNYLNQIKEFADSIGIDAGIVAGRIGREMGLWKYVSSLRKSLRFADE